jgi:uncharacterized protein involved in outer membrane biogenesis
VARLLRIGGWSLLGLLVLVVAGVAVIALGFNPDSLKPRIVAAVRQATGRDLTLQGRMRVGWSLQPTLTVERVSFANPPGFSRPEMATLERLDVKLAVIPLLSNRVEIERLVLVKPDIILETDAQGRPNWRFTPEARPTTPATTVGTAHDVAHDGVATRISVADVRIESGTLTWRDGRSGRSTVIGLTGLHADAASPDGDLHLTMAATYGGAPFSLTGEFGPLNRLEGGQGAAAWPVQAKLEAGRATLALDGSVAQPMLARGYRGKVAANVPDLAGLAPFLPGVNLPPLHEVSLAAQVADTGAAVPDISGLTLHVGASDLTGVVAGLRLDKLDLAAAHLDQPVQVSAQGSLNGMPATVAGSIGAPSGGLLSGIEAATSFPLDLIVQALGSNLTIKGTAARGGDGRPSVQAEVASDHIDLDAIRAALPRPTPAVAGAAPATATSKPPASSRVIPDTPIPFDLLRRADADLKLNVAQLVSGGATYRAIATHLDLHGGKLRLDPVSADLPQGHLDGSLDAEADQAVPTVALRLRAPALAVQPLLAALGEPGYLSGNLSVQADLRGAGATPHAIAASVDGSLALSMVNGSMDNRLLGSSLGSILRAANLLDLVGRGGTSEVQCFIARLDANHGIATVRPLVFVSSLLTADGDGSLNLAAETLDLRLRPQARLAGVGIVIPIRISGPFRSPSTVSDPAAAIGQNAGTVAGAVLSGATPLGALAGALGGKQLLGGSEATCGPSGGAASPGRAAPSAPLQKLPKAGDVLKQLFR